MEFIVKKSYSISCSSKDNNWNGEFVVSSNGLILGHTEDRVITGIYLKNHGIKLRVVGDTDYSEYYYFDENTSIEKKDDLVYKCNIKLNNIEKTIKLNINEKMNNMCFSSKCALLNILEEPHMHSQELIKR